jgi:Cu-Zn family superoxide dismutase
MKMLEAVAVSMFLLTACATPREATGPQATATLRPASGSQVHGEVTFTQIGVNRVRVIGEVAGHSTGAKGFHIHEKGDCSAPDAMSAGGHFNPMNARHGASPTGGHAGDMGNITFNDSGKATINTVIEGVSVSSDAQNGIIGRAVIVHMQADDLKTDPTGNAGERAACGVIS